MCVFNEELFKVRERWERVEGGVGGGGLVLTIQSSIAFVWTLQQLAAVHLCVFVCLFFGSCFLSEASVVYCKSVHVCVAV